MKILYMKLKNYACIYTGMGVKTLEVDLSESTNTIIMLLGPNGIGKTSILSCFHPYSYNTGVDDGKSDQDLILKGKDGYKEIHYDMNGSFVKIKHFFYSKKDDKRSVKSFIELDGQELNENGNVTSFIKIINELFGIDPSFLTLLRLGSNVKNFIDKKYSERKDFSANLMSDIEVYLKYYKNGSDEIRDMKSLINNYSNKLSRLNIQDIELYTSSLNSKEQQLKNLETNNEIINKEIGSSEMKISMLISNKEEFNKELNKSEKRLIYLRDKVSTSNISTDIDYNEYQNELNSQLINIKSKISELINKINGSNVILSDLYDKKKDLEISKSSLVSEDDYNDLENKVSEMKNRIEMGDEEFKNYNPKFSSEDLIQLIVIIDMIMESFNDIYAYPLYSIKEVVDLRGTGPSIYTSIYDNLNNCIVEINKLETKLLNVVNGPKEKSGFMYIMLRPEGCTIQDCPYIEYYNDHHIEDKESETEKINRRIQTLKNHSEVYRGQLFIDAKISELFFQIDSYKDLIERTNSGSFLSKQNLLYALRNQEKLYDTALITSRIDIRERYDEYLEEKKSIELFKRDLELMANNINTINKVHEEMNDVTLKIQKEENYQLDLKKELSLTSDMKTKKIDEINDIENKIEFLKNINAYKDEINTLEILINEMESKKEEVDNLEDTLVMNYKNKSELEFSINKLKKEIELDRFKMMEYTNTVRELDSITYKYDEYLCIRESVSGNKGIPLLYQQMNQARSKTTMNQFLDLKYNGNLRVDNFIINEKEYRIPYIKNGISVPDISYCSQGEKSFMTIALSFSLLIQSVEKYNIMLLDEVDSTLDTSSRRIFLDLLEKLLIMIKADQAFVISHNNMFDNYPVDVLKLEVGKSYLKI